MLFVINTTTFLGSEILTYLVDIANTSCSGYRSASIEAAFSAMSGENSDEMDISLDLLSTL